MVKFMARNIIDFCNSFMNYDLSKSKFNTWFNREAVLHFNVYKSKLSHFLLNGIFVVDISN